MNFKHTGLFPEQAARTWDFIRQMVASRGGLSAVQRAEPVRLHRGGHLGRCCRRRCLSAM